jgi:hypothetical protein
LAVERDGPYEIFTHARVDASLIRARRAKHELKGLEAIFTSESHVRNSEVLIGAAGVAAGLFLSTFAVFQTEVHQALGARGQAIYSPLAFGSIGLLLLICGAGTVMFALANRETKLENSMESSTDERSEVDSPQGAEGLRTRRKMFGPGSKLGSVAFIEGLMLDSLYAGFLQEYESNLTLQIWVRSNLPVGQLVLNWEGVLILSASLGLLLLQFLPGRFLSE